MDREQVFNNALDWLTRREIDYTLYNINSDGFTSDEMLLVADWNKVPAKFIEWLEYEFGSVYNPDSGNFPFICNLGWNDEYTSCDECGAAVRIVATGYGWLPSWAWTSDCSIVCCHCIPDCIEDIIEHYKNDTNMAVMPNVVALLQDSGFICYSPDEYCAKFETGFYPGQNDDPKEVALDIERNLPNHDYIFHITSTGQFDTHWTVFLRRKDYNEDEE